MTNRLHKSQTNRAVAGVCGGLGEYFDLDPTLVRLLFVLLAFWHGVGALAYLVLWVVMPEAASVERAPREVVQENLARLRTEAERLGTGLRGTPPSSGEPVAGEPVTYASSRTTADRQLIAGGLLVLVGLILLMENLRLFWWLNFGQLWPLALIAAGGLLLYQQTQRR